MNGQRSQSTLSLLSGMNEVKVVKKGEINDSKVFNVFKLSLLDKSTSL